jgi:hypothetical protein
MVNDNWNIVVHNPLLFELSSKNGTLLNTHLSYTGGSVGEVANEDWLKMFEARFFTEDNGKISDEFEYTHSDSPLSILCHISELI